MKDDDSISDEQLNSLLDNELVDEERATVLDAIQNNKDTSVRYYALQQIKDLVKLAYHEPVSPIQTRHLSPGSKGLGWIDTTKTWLSRLLH